MSFWKRLIPGKNASRSPHFVFSREAYSNPRTLWEAAHVARAGLDQLWLALPQAFREEREREASSSDPLNTDANALFSQGRIEEAISKYEQAVTFLRGNAIAYTNLCLAYNKLSDMGMVAKISLTAIISTSGAIRGNNSGYKAFRWLVIAMQALEGDRSPLALEELAKLQADSPGLHWCCGSDYFSKKSYKEAIDQFNIAVAINDNFFLAHYDLGRSYLNLGIEDRALACFEIAREHAPSDGLGVECGGYIEKWIVELRQKLRV